MTSSDVDVLVEFEPRNALGWEVITLENELSARFGKRPVDLVEEKYLNRWIRKRVLESTEVLYIAVE